MGKNLVCPRWKGPEPKEGGQVLNTIDWMEKVEDVVAVELEPSEAVWKWEELVARQVVMMVVVGVEVHGLAVHEVHEEQPREVVVLHACHGKCFSDLITHLLQERARVRRRRIFGSGRLSICRLSSRNGM